MQDIVRAFVSFIVRLREEFFLPKHAMNTITDYIGMLIDVLKTLLKRSAVTDYPSDSPPSMASKMKESGVIALRTVESLVSQRMNIVSLK